LEGDSNAIYFHTVANGRYSKKLIHSLVHEEGMIEGHEQLKSYITNYYKWFFGEPGECDLSTDENQINDILKFPLSRMLFSLLLSPRSK
jgi:hypothetical protein